MSSEYRFTRHSDGVYLVTTPAAAGEAWRLLDGAISVHAGGRVACVALLGEDQAHTAAVLAAWSTWWLAEYGDR